jgi:hypothetical protein
MTMEIVLGGRQPLASQAGLVTFASGIESMTIDARRLEFVTPLDTAGIAAIAHSSALVGASITLLMPQEFQVARYLEQAGLMAAMPGRTTYHGRVSVEPHEYPSERLLPVAHLSHDTIDHVADVFGTFVAAYYPASIGLAMSSACNELLANAEEHGASLSGSFVAAQIYTGQTTGSPRLELAVCDNGVGVLTHLRQNPSLSYLQTDPQALSAALQRGTSGVTDHRGNGLPDLVAKASEFGEIHLHLRSGAGEVTIRSGSPSPAVAVRPRLDQTEGTWAWLTHEASDARHAVIKSVQ